LQWCEYYQLKQYEKVMRDTRVKVFVMIGLGGHSWAPEHTFLIDLEKTPYPKLFKSAYEPMRSRGRGI